MKRLTIALAAISLTVACSGAKQKPRDEKVPVSVAVAEQKDVPTQITAIGSVQPISTVAVKALVGGQLTRVWFREGDDVRREQMLFTIDPRPYQAAVAQAEANLARDQAQLKNAEAEAARYAELVKKDYVTHEEYDKFTSAAAAARAVVASDRAAVENARLQVSYCDIRSPMSGRTGSLQVHAGNIVHPNDQTPLVVINQVAPVYVQFAIPETQLGQVRARGEMPVTAMSQNGSAALAEGKLSFVDNAVDASTGTITLKATFGNETHALWPGQFVTVALTLKDRPDAITVPATAVQTGQRGQYVYVVKQDKSVEMRNVQVAESDQSQAVVTKGLTPGETVVTDGQLRLTPKSKVEIKNSSAE